ncbi:hypothetical protein [Diaphorobacter sp. J5-51]|uniref:hypothetical protein n=1 Tax=Diaphorobacter sp. J5-51 TaxID=680496 RepID=UPI0012F9DA0E|nr:hypothetical protein [Diaphorobacter sp. J5-51]
MKINNQESNDPLAKLPSWQLLCIMLGSVGAVVSLLYLTGVLLFSLSHWEYALGAFVFCGGLALALIPKGTH